MLIFVSVQFSIATFSDFSNVNLFAQRRAETVRFTTVCCFKSDLFRMSLPIRRSISRLRHDYAETAAWLT